MADILGTNVSAPIRPRTTDDPKATAHANEIKGAPLRFADAAERADWLTWQVDSFGGSIAAASANDRSRLAIGQEATDLDSKRKWRVLVDGWEEITLAEPELLNSKADQTKVAAEALRTTRFAADLQVDRSLVNFDAMVGNAAPVDYLGAPNVSVSAAAGNLGWSVGFLADLGGVGSGCMIDIDNTIAVKTLKVHVYQRVAESAYGGVPDEGPDEDLDTQIWEATVDVSGLEQTGPGEFTTVFVPFDGVPINNGYYHAPKWEAFAADGVTPVPIGARFRTGEAPPETNATQIRRGYYKDGSGWHDFVAEGWVRVHCLFLTRQIDVAAGARAQASVLGKPATVYQTLPQTALVPDRLNDVVDDDSYGRWMSGAKLAKTAVLNGVGWYLDPVDTSVFYVRMKLFRQVTGPALTGTTTGMVPEYEISLRRNELFGFDTAGEVVFPVPSKLYPENTRFVSTVEAFDITGARVALGVDQQAHVFGQDEGFEQGAYALLTDPADVWRAMPGGFKPWLRLVTETVEGGADGLTAVATSAAMVETLDQCFPESFTTGWTSYAANWKTWWFGYRPERTVDMAALEIALQNLDQLLTVRLRAFRRLPSAVGADLPGSLTSDVKMFERRYFVADLIGTNRKSRLFERFKFDLSDIGVVTPDQLLMFDLQGYDAGGNIAPIGMGECLDAPAGDQPWLRGGHQVGDTVLAVDTHVARRIYVREPEESAHSLMPVAQSKAPARQFNTGYTVDLPAVKIRQMGVARKIPASVATFDAPASAAVVDEVISLIYNNGPFGLPGQALTYQWATNLDVRDQASNTPLTYQYAHKPNTGRIYGTIPGGSFPIKVSYTGHKARYDLVYADPRDGSVHVLKGTDRIIDPENYRPQLPARMIALWSVKVTVEGVELIPVHKFTRRRRNTASGLAQYSEMMERNRRLLPRLFRRALQGLPIRLLGYGDSIGGIGLGPHAPPNWQLVPGAGRDPLDSYAERIPADTRATIPQFSGAADGDFTGPGYYDGTPGTGYTSTGHVKIGWSWYLKAAIEERLGVDCSYLNMSVPGSWSANSTFNAGYGLNGLHPDRIAAATALDTDVMVLCFGMNELGRAGFFEDMCAIITAYREATGGDVILITVPQINPYGHLADAATWWFTHDEAMRVAEHMNCAIISTAWLFSPGQEGATGLSLSSLCNANLSNHPFAELAYIGQMLAELIP